MHAGFLGRDVLLVHDEAHLETPFQTLLEKIVAEQRREKERSSVCSRDFRIIALSATRRPTSADENSAASQRTFTLSGPECTPPQVLPSDPTEPIHHVWQRLKARKTLRFQLPEANEKTVERISKLARGYSESGAAVLIFVRGVDDVSRIQIALKDQNVEILTGTLRGKERDELVETATFQRFLKGSTSDGTVYLICTSAGEVGLDISADHLICDLTPFDSMVQRFGRVNRYGKGDAAIDVVHESEFDAKSLLDVTREKDSGTPQTTD